MVFEDEGVLLAVDFELSVPPLNNSDALQSASKGAVYVDGDSAGSGGWLEPCAADGGSLVQLDLSLMVRNYPPKASGDCEWHYPTHPVPGW